MLRVERNERLVCARGVLVAELLEVELAEVAVDTALVGAGTLYSEVRGDRLGASDARETQADDAEGVLDPPAGVLVLGRDLRDDGRIFFVQSFSWKFPDFF